MKRFKAWLRNFFFPPEGSPMWVRVLPYAVLGVLTLFLISATVVTWEYTNSSVFCGTTCHTMPPEYSAFLVSPHARIDCVDCHIGKGFITTRVTRKAGDLKHIFATAFHTYEFPIRAGDLRPARETCEKCHYPEKFSDDSLREVKRFQNDKNNTPYSTYLTLKTGGGTTRQGLGKGIHWHIENQIQYLATDEEQQQIPYVRVTNPDGTTTEYTDISAGIDPSKIDPTQLKDMDCITCHNRITHMVQNPDDAVDQMIGRGEIDAAIPEIRRVAVDVYSGVYDTQEKGLARIASLEEFYKTYYPDYYADNTGKVQDAIAALQQSYKGAVFPEQNSDWNSHPTNIGHKNSPGCFRCHDGKHLDKENNAIRLECNLCHSVPVVAGPNDYVAKIEISRGPEPDTHRSANWIGMHNQAFDSTCSNCHNTADPGGTSNTSFCSNSACHGSKWSFAGLDAPALRPVILSQLPPTPTPMPTPQPGAALTYNSTIGPLFQMRCGACHGSNATQGLNLTTYATAMAGGKDGPVIVPGDPKGSLLIQKQTNTAQPHFSQLTPAELELVMKWIEAGAPEQ